jgi:hypothetical protein
VGGFWQRISGFLLFCCLFPDMLSHFSWFTCSSRADSWYWNSL